MYIFGTKHLLLFFLFDFFLVFFALVLHWLAIFACVFVCVCLLTMKLFLLRSVFNGSCGGASQPLEPTCLWTWTWDWASRKHLTMCNKLNWPKRQTARCLLFDKKNHHTQPPSTNHQPPSTKHHPTTTHLYISL